MNLLTLFCGFVRNDESAYYAFKSGLPYRTIPHDPVFRFRAGVGGMVGCSAGGDMNPTNIEYLDFTWNPIAMRCTPVSEGCKHCWHIRRAKMLTRNTKISLNARLGYSGSAPVLMTDRLDDPLKRKKPARIGVQFMGDLGHDDIDYEWIDDIFDVMTAAKQHTFIILTKRPDSLLKWHNETITLGGGDYLPNVYLGISAENQPTLDERLRYLLQIPAAKRFVSLEPMLGPVDLTCIEYLSGQLNTLTGKLSLLCKPNIFINRKLDWVIVGGLSLPGGKIQAPKSGFIDNILRDCDNAGVPIFLKDNAQYPIERKEFPG